jgi:para-aminobenzoate synthetase component 1
MLPAGSATTHLASRAYPPNVASLLAVPDPSTFPVVLRVGAGTVVAADPVEIVCADGADALAALDTLTPGWWAGFLSFDLGRAVEHVDARLRADDAIPGLLLARYDARLVTDDDGMRWEGSAAGRRRLERLLDASSTAPPTVSGIGLGRARSSLDQVEFEAGVRAIVALVEAGECYQVNLTRRLLWEHEANVVALHRSLVATNPAPHAGTFVLPRPGRGPITVVGASPERFLSWRGGEVETRPIKGTGTDPDRLGASAKDRAENLMIVDLARNDLGRVCEYGSVHVPELFALEQHPGLWHLVSTVRGTRRAGVGLGELVRATFPPASVTGAPKPRVLQAIEDLEPVRRGVYCGATGWLDTEHDAGDLAVAIRTFVVADGVTALGVGGGIVADSDPTAEWRETELKAARLLAAAGARDAAPWRRRLTSPP